MMAQKAVSITLGSNLDSKNWALNPLEVAFKWAEVAWATIPKKGSRHLLFMRRSTSCKGRGLRI
mgnify:FL=1